MMHGKISAFVLFVALVVSSGADCSALAASPAAGPVLAQDAAPPPDANQPVPSPVTPNAGQPQSGATKPNANPPGPAVGNAPPNATALPAPNAGTTLPSVAPLNPGPASTGITITPENRGINVNTNPDGTALPYTGLTATTPNGTSNPGGAGNSTGGLNSTFGGSGTIGGGNGGSQNTRNALGSLYNNRDVYGTYGSAYPNTGYFQQRGVLSVPNIGRPLNGVSPNGIDPRAAFFPSLPQPRNNIAPNSGYGISNGSRPTHMDARGIQRLD